MIRKCAAIAALMLVLAPAAARADWLFTPSVGGVFGGDANEHLTYGASIGWMGAGIFGFEAELGYTPSFFEQGDEDFDLFDDSNVTTFMVNALVGIPIGGQTGGGFRPYVTGGVGLLRSSLSGGGELFDDIDSNDFGVNVGAGAIAFVSDHVGIRGDLRYFRALNDSEGGDGVDFDLGDFDFWRATGGVTFRW